MRLVVRLLPLVVATLLAGLVFALPSQTRTASAHPLGNFSVNRLSIIEVTGEGVVNLRYVVDMAEIPTFQAINAIDPDGDGALSQSEKDTYLLQRVPALLGNLRLEVDGERLAFTAMASDMELLEGQAGLKTARIVIDARALTLTLSQRERGSGDGQPGVSASYKDGNFSGQNGWRQVIVRPGAGIDLFETTAPAEDVTRELTVYPEELLKSAPAVTQAGFAFRQGETSAAAADAPSGEGGVSRDEAGRTLGRFASLVDRERLTPAFVALALLLAAGWGAMHALGPGHGKTVVAAYLVGERGTGRHALYLGLIVTATHTISVFTLGAIALFASSVIDTDDLYFWLSLASGLIVAGLGGGLLYSRVRRLRRAGGMAVDLAAFGQGAGAGGFPASEASRKQSPHPNPLPEGEGIKAPATHPKALPEGEGTGSGSLPEGEGIKAPATHPKALPEGAGIEALATHGHGDGRHQHHHHGHGDHEHRHDHIHPHSHDYHHGTQDSDHGHSHVPTQPGWRGLVALGVSGGIVPCPTALVVMLGAIAIDRAVYGLVLVTAFSAGLAGVLTGIGLLLVYGRRFLERRRFGFFSSRLIRRVQLVSPVLSALGIMGLGLVLTGRAML